MRFELASDGVVGAVVVVVPMPTLPAAAAEAVEPSAPARRRCQVEPRVFPAHNQHRKMHVRTLQESTGRCGRREASASRTSEATQ